MKEFFDHYEPWFKHASEVALNFATGNGDHILNYAGKDRWSDSFDWAGGSETLDLAGLLDRDRFNLLEGGLAPEDFLDPILHEGGHPLLEA